MYPRGTCFPLCFFFSPFSNFNFCLFEFAQLTKLNFNNNNLYYIQLIATIQLSLTMHVFAHQLMLVWLLLILSCQSEEKAKRGGLDSLGGGNILFVSILLLFKFSQIS